MGKIVTGLFMSLDGVVDADDDWQFRYFDEEFFSSMTAAQNSAGAVLVGRRSYEGYEQLRVEYPDSPALAFLDATPTYIVSSTLTSAAASHVTILDTHLPTRVAQLRRDTDGDVLVLGSPTLVRWLLAHGLLDELHLLVLPTIVGSGPRLFTEMPSGRLPLRLQESKALSTGTLELRYTPTSS